MLLRGKTWQFKARIPTDLLHHYRSRSSKFIEESLRTSNIAEARRLRDVKLQRFQKLWAEMRLQDERGNASASSPSFGYSSDDSDMLDIREDEDSASDYLSLLGEKIDRIAQRIAAKKGIHDLEDARDVAIAEGEGAELWRKVQLLKGDLTPLEPYCREWFATKSGKAHKTQIEYQRAIRILLDRFEFLEDVKHRKVKRFLHELLHESAKATVGKYATAFRGVWRYHGWPGGDSLWSISDMDSHIPEIAVRSLTDDEYVHIMGLLQGTRRRKLWLAIRIAAYTGASRSGVCGLKAEGLGTDRPTLFLPETKKDWRTRRIPCHPAIVEDVKEWCAAPLAMSTVTNGFTEVKQEAGLGREVVYHSLRHSVVNKLENARVSTREIKRLVGHRIGNLTFDTYSAEGLGYEVLEDVVSKIKWPCLSRK